jgi:hypothetical protein
MDMMAVDSGIRYAVDGTMIVATHKITQALLDVFIEYLQTRSGTKPTRWPRASYTVRRMRLNVCCGNRQVNKQLPRKKDLTGKSIAKDSSHHVKFDPGIDMFPWFRLLEARSATLR